MTAVQLVAAQTAALAHVQALADRDRGPASDRAASSLAGAGIDSGVQELCTRIFDVARVALNFHPDRIARDGRTVVEALLDDGVYRNQFETGISNGGLGAIRNQFEERLFGGAYRQAGLAAGTRPKYGGLDLVGHPDGPCPRFGSCHLRLKREVMFRTTFSFGDSVTDPSAVGTVKTFEPVLAAVLSAAEAGGHRSVVASCTTVLGLKDPTVATVVSLLTGHAEPPIGPGRALDDYIEAQVHGSVAVPDDGEAVVADRSFDGTLIGSRLNALATRYGLSLRWHDGFELSASDVPADFRGPRMPELAERIAVEFGDGNNRLNAEIVGRAAQNVVTDPARWSEWGDTTETLVEIKQLWHVLVAYGAPGPSNA